MPPALSPIRVTPPGQDRLAAAIARATTAASWWREQTPVRARPAARGDAPSYLLSVPDIGLACEVLLADRLFHDLSSAEREGLAGWIRATQQPSGAWHDAAGRPDPSRTALGWWALVESGDDPDAEHLVRARRIVHELGGAQRGSIEVRLWLAMAGHIPWAWLPTMPAELWLLPTVAWLSPSRVSPWARGVMTPYLLLSRAPARVHVSSAAALLLQRPDGEPILPRLVQPGLLGDLLQAFDQGVKLVRKLPRGPVLRAALARVQRWMVAAQQAHGGWFAAHPTLLSLIALRVLGANFDDPRIVRGLAYLRRARGLVHTTSGPQMAQGLSCTPLTTLARMVRLALVCDPTHPTNSLAAGEAALPFLLGEEIRQVGEWQLRTNAPAGGWPCEAGADRYVDTLSTCAVLDALHAVPKSSLHQSQVRAAMRRAVEVLLAMQEPDGGFARFERGESEVFMTRFPLRDARLLAAGSPTDNARVRVSAAALRQLGRLGFQADDDRIARGVQWLWQRVTVDMAGFDLATLGELALCSATLCPPTHPLRQTIERQLRGRQREDGSFGSAVDTASAMHALMALEGAVCIQTQRAARHLVHLLDSAPLELAEAELSERLGGEWTPGLGLTPLCHDPSAGVREAALALAMFAERGGQL
jgi:squalene-hopene/tetraprenyl-beta-curcumene cyclase